MKIFLTGGTGTIGGAILSNLLSHGHRVTCTVKDLKARQTLLAAFPDESRLSLVDIYLSTTCGPELTHLAKDHDCIIHSVHSLAKDYHAMEEACLRAFLTAGRITTSSGRPSHLITTTDIGTIGTPPQEADETASTDHPLPVSSWRVPIERLVLEEKSFVTTVVRPVWVYGGSEVDRYVEAVKRRGQIVAPVIDGTFGVIHKNDLAELYRLIVEKRASGVFHGAEPQYYSTSQLLGQLLPFCGDKVPIRTERPQDFVREFTIFIRGMALQQKAIPRRSIELGWSPKYNFMTSFQELYGR